MKRQITPIDTSKALHQIQVQASVRQLGHMEQHCRTLLDVLDIMLEETYAAAPCRRHDFRLDRKKRQDPRLPEERLQDAIWEHWSCQEQFKGNLPFLAGFCNHIQAYQLPLKGVRADKGWGRIDLVGVSLEGHPIVIELKQERGTDTPLRMLVEAVAYALALRKAWNQGGATKAMGGFGNRPIAQVFCAHAADSSSNRSARPRRLLEPVYRNIRKAH